MFRPLALLATAGVLLAACGEDLRDPADAADPTTSSTSGPDASEPPVATSAPPDDTGGLGLPVRAAGELGPTPGQWFTGTIRVRDDGCWMLDVNGEQRLVALPAGFALRDGDTTVLVAGDGVELTDGVAIDAAGQLLFAGPDDELGRWGEMLSFCGGVEIAVIDSLELAHDPGTLDDEQRSAAFAAASFSESWRCGYGFAASTPDQRLGLVITADVESIEPGVVDLANGAWVAEAIVGKHLFVQNCDDAVEQWEPSPIIVASWPVVAGQIDVGAAAGPVEGCSDNPVTATLVGAVIRTPTGDVELAPVALENAAWGCFAG